MAEDNASSRLSPENALPDSASELSTMVARLQAMADSLPVLISYVDRHHRYQFNNKAYEHWLARPRAEIVGRHLKDVLGPKTYALVRPRIDEALAGAKVSFEQQVEQNGTHRHVQVDYVPDRQPDGTVAGIYALVQDITERKAAERALNETESRFRTMFECAGVGMVLIDEDCNIFDANAAFCAIVGRELSSLRGTTCMEITHPDDKAKNEEVIVKLAQPGEKSASFEKRYIRPDGRQVWVRINLSKIETGDRQRALAIVEDISARKAVETALHESETRLREESQHLETLNRIGSALAGELDLERVVQMVTDAGVELIGAQFGAFFYNVTDQGGESYMLYTLSGADRSQFDKFGMPRNTKVFAPTFGGDGIVRSDDITADPRYGQNPPHKGMPKGHLPVRSYLAVPVIGRTDEVIGGLFFGHPETGRFEERDERLMEAIAAQAAIAFDGAKLFQDAQREIEQRMAAERALTALNETLESRVAEEIERRSQAEEALRQTQKMETVGQLSGGIAHDFNNLLQIIHGNLTMLQRSLRAADAKLQRSVTNALTGTERAAALTQRLLAFSRRQPLDPKPLDLNRLITEMSDLLHRTLGETVEVQTVLRPGIPMAEVDRNQLENAILNLAINGRDAMGDGGLLVIETDQVELDDSYTELHPETEPGCYVRISVRDNGPGMDPDTLNRAIEPFFTTKEVGQGTGLGLSMVYGFVKQSGGHLSLRSESGAGTTAEIFLPCSATAGDGEMAEPRRTELRPGRGETILVCEDDDDVRRFSTETLTDLGYQVIEAADAGSALAALRDRGRVDLLFTDVVLPGKMTGVDLAREAHEVQPDLKVLFTTGYARSALGDQHRIEPGLDLIAKPFGVNELAERIRMLLD